MDETKDIGTTAREVRYATRQAIAAQIRAAFPGFKDDTEVNGADAVEWLGWLLAEIDAERDAELAQCGILTKEQAS